MIATLTGKCRGDTLARSGRSRHQRALSRPKWAEVRLLALDRDGWRCTQCGRRGRLEVDHIKRMGDGGAAYDLGNLQTLCRPCHFAKTFAENGGKVDLERDAWKVEIQALV